MIWIIGGTSEARLLVNRISDLDNFIVTLATEGGREFIESDKLLVARLSKEEMEEFVEKNMIEIIVDLTHPFAKIVSENAREVSDKMGIRYVRYSREITEETTSALYFNSYEEVYHFLSKVEKKNVFLTTGSKNIADFEKIRGNNRFIYRILPALESIEIAVSNGVSMKDTVAILGPFSKAHNKLHLLEYEADYCIMKDSGLKGGTLDKIQACEELGVVALVIAREQEEGHRNLDSIEEIIRSVGEENG